MWLNCNGIANLLSIPQLEKYGQRITYNTLKYWIVYTHEGVKVKFKRDTNICNHITYIYMRCHLEAFAMVQTACKNFEGYTKKKVEKDILNRKVQVMIGHPANDKFK